MKLENKGHDHHRAHVKIFFSGRKGPDYVVYKHRTSF
jgi:hypothetical protein